MQINQETCVSVCIYAYIYIYVHVHFRPVLGHRLHPPEVLSLQALLARGACVVRRAAAPSRAEEALENAAKLEDAPEPGGWGGRAGAIMFGMGW